MGLFSKNKVTATTDIKTYSPLRVRLDCIIDLNLFKMLVHNEYLIFNNPGKSHQVTHVGHAVSYGLNVNRFYINSMDSEGESMLQVTDNNGNLQSDDIMLFREIITIFPKDANEWCDWMGDDNEIGKCSSEYFTIEDDNGQEITYKAISDMLPVDIEFNVTPSKSQNEEPYTMPTTSALFKRNIAAEGQLAFFEYLLVSVEDEERITIYAGMKLPVSQITIN